MAKRKRRYYDSYESVKSVQHAVKQVPEVVHDWEIDDMVINNHRQKTNKKQRSRIGYIETRKPR